MFVNFKKVINKKISLSILFTFILTGCSKTVTEEFLIGGHWVGTAGYENEKKEAPPNCYPFHKGVEFGDETTVYVDEADREFEYSLVNKDYGTVIEFYDPITYLRSYHIKKISKRIRLNKPGMTNLTSAHRKGTIAHEIGHAIGLAHNNKNPYSIMCQYQGGKRIVTAAGGNDLLGMNYLY